jgi:hypothetical protein
MLKKIVYILFLFVGTIKGFSQKINNQQLDASGIEKLVINSNLVFLVSIVAEKTDKISIETKIAGEHFENVIVTTSEKNKTLTIGTSYTPFFLPENDKLAAHKIIFIEMKISIPELLEVSVNSTLATVNAEGAYDFFYVALENGNCIVTNFTGNASIRTKQGNIIVYATKEVSGSAISKNGMVTNRVPSEGRYHIIAESLEGDISLLQTK